MKKLEIILCAITLVGLTLAKQHIGGGIILTVVSFLSLAVFYLFFSAFLMNDITFKGLFRKESYKGVKAGRIVWAIFSGNSLSMGVLGILFPLLHWQGADVMLFNTFLVLLLTGIITLIMQLVKPLKYKTNILIRIAAFSLVAILVKTLG